MAEIRCKTKKIVEFEFTLSEEDMRSLRTFLNLTAGRSREMRSFGLPIESRSPVRKFILDFRETVNQVYTDNNTDNSDEELDED